MFEKGQSGNPQGRKAGIPNKSTGKLREMLSQVVNGYFESKDFQEDWRALDSRDRVKFAIDLMGFTLPKLSATSVDITEESKKSFGDELSRLKEEEELKRISPF
jgi:hypothetical protein